jgi:hypothetical protein
MTACIIAAHRLLEVLVVAAQEGGGAVIARRPREAEALLLRRAGRLGALARACRCTADAVGCAATQLLRALVGKGSQCLASDRSSLPTQARACCELLRQFTRHSRKASNEIQEARNAHTAPQPPHDARDGSHCAVHCNVTTVGHSERRRRACVRVRVRALLAPVLGRRRR